MFLDKRANVVSLTNGTETTGHIKKKKENEFIYRSYSFHKNYLKTDHRLKSKT